MMETSRAATPRVRTHVTFAGEFDSSKVSLLSTKGNGQVLRPSLYQLRSSMRSSCDGEAAARMIGDKP